MQIKKSERDISLLQISVKLLTTLGHVQPVKRAAALNTHYCSKSAAENSPHSPSVPPVNHTETFTSSVGTSGLVAESHRLGWVL